MLPSSSVHGPQVPQDSFVSGLELDAFLGFFETRKHSNVFNKIDVYVDR